MKKAQRKTARYLYRLNKLLCAWNSGSKFDAGDKTIELIKTLEKKIQLHDLEFTTNL